MNHRIVVSAENNSYTGWQCKLFYFSCVTRLGQQPLIIVHDSGRDWHSDFYDLLQTGCEIRPAPNYRFAGRGDDYYPRNTAGTLIHAAESCSEEDFIVLFDSDMIFARQPHFPSALSGDFVSYMNFEKDFARKAMREFGIHRELENAEKESLRCGVPYVIPVAGAQQLARTWLNAIDAFSSRRWEDIMYAFGLATLKLGLKVELTYEVAHNFQMDDRLDAAIIHYCYGDERWNKRDYFDEHEARTVWQPTLNGAEDTILGELIKQIKEAGQFYRDVYFPNRLSGRRSPIKST